MVEAINDSDQKNPLHTNADPANALHGVVAAAPGIFESLSAKLLVSLCFMSASVAAALPSAGLFVFVTRWNMSLPVSEPSHGKRFYVESIFPFLSISNQYL
jgi:hypothetical protein